MKAEVKKVKPTFHVELTAEEIVHLEAALDFATKGNDVDVTLNDCFGIFEDHQSDGLLFELWRGFSKMRDEVMENGGLDDE
jgi:hypothetical protein